MEVTVTLDFASSSSCSLEKRNQCILLSKAFLKSPWELVSNHLTTPWTWAFDVEALILIQPLSNQNIELWLQLLFVPYSTLTLNQQALLPAPKERKLKVSSCLYFILSCFSKETKNLSGWNSFGLFHIFMAYRLINTMVSWGISKPPILQL